MDIFWIINILIIFVCSAVENGTTPEDTDPETDHALSCSNTTQAAFKYIVNSCFDINHYVTDRWERSDSNVKQSVCSNIKSLLRIVPSCSFCNDKSYETNRLSCCYAQARELITNNRVCQCKERKKGPKKYKGSKKKRRKEDEGESDMEKTLQFLEEVLNKTDQNTNCQCESFPDITTITSTAATTTAARLPDTENKRDSAPTVAAPTSSLVTEAITGPCDRSTEVAAIRCGPAGKFGVSTAAAIGLFIFGIVLGVLVTAIICTCIPVLHRKSSQCLLRKQKKEVNIEILQEMNMSPDENRNLANTDEFGVSSSLRHHGHGDYDARRNVTDSHIYTGLDQPKQALDKQNSNRASDIYDAPDFQPTSDVNTNESPTHYLEPITTADTSNMDNANAAAADKPLYQPLSTNRNEDADYDQTDQTTREMDSNDPSNHNYFLLQAQPHGPTNLNNGNSPDQGQTPGGEPQYFVHERQNEMNEMPSNQVNTKTDDDSPSHDYFVLQKDNS